MRLGHLFYRFPTITLPTRMKPFATAITLVPLLFLGRVTSQDYLCYVYCACLTAPFMGSRSVDSASTDSLCKSSWEPLGATLEKNVTENNITTLRGDWCTVDPNDQLDGICFPGSDFLQGCIDLGANSTCCSYDYGYGNASRTYGDCPARTVS